VQRSHLASLLLIGAAAVAVGIKMHRPASETTDEAGSTEPVPAEPVAATEPTSQPVDYVPGEAVDAYEGGKFVGTLARREAEAAGYTIVDLGDDWTPYIFDEDPALGATGKQPYRKTFLALANEEFGKGPEWTRAKNDRYLELYGIFPSFRVLRARLADDARHACHAAVEDDVLDALERPPMPGVEIPTQRGRVRTVANLRAQLAKAGYPESAIGEGAAPPKVEKIRVQLAPIARVVDGIRATQAHLKCDGLLPARAEDGVFDMWTADALKIWQRKHMIIAWGNLSGDTRKALRTDSRELDYRAVLRALRERVVDALGLIEDGSAASKWGDVVERGLDAAEFHAMEKRGALKNGAPDLISPATDAAARDLGWVSPEATRAFFDERPADYTKSRKVALKLPKAPSYHAKNMDLSVVIDRGDVYYDFPYDERGERLAQPVRRRPSVTLYAKDGDTDVALVRWNTTIGGWKNERLDTGEIGMRYKESYDGDRVWRELVASPAWLPPETTPQRELVKYVWGKGWLVDQEQFGPGYASAYGLVMFINHKVVPGATPEETRYGDQGIRVHGSVNYPSILGGASHGCHRLFNHLAVRLGSFVLAHRPYVRRGKLDVNYAHEFEWKEEKMKLEIKTRGYGYELDPPIPVKVLKGTVRGTLQRATVEAMPLPSELQKRAKEQAEQSESDDLG
jgi:hypothetical protein